MRMRRILSIVLVTVLLASAVPLMITPAAAYETKIPFAGENNELTKEELANAILPYMLGEGDLKLDDVGDAAWVYAHWDGVPKRCVDQGIIVSPGSVLEAPPKSLTLYRPVERIVVLSTRSIDAVRSLKAADKVVGVPRSESTDKARYYQEFFGFPVADAKSLESIIDLHPDVAILSSGTSEHNLDALESAGITVLYRAKYYALDSCVEAYRQLGCLIDKEEEAEEFGDFYEGWLDLIKETVDEIPEENKPRVYCQHCIYSMRKGYSPYSSGDYGRLPELAGGKVIFADIPGSVSVEEVIKRDPEIIVWCGAWGAPYIDFGFYYDLDVGDITAIKAVRDEVMNRAELQNVTAIKNGEVYVIDSSIYCCGGLYFIGECYLAKIFHPTLFEELDPKAIHQEYLTRFQGLDIDLDEKGVFVYHPEHFPDGH